MMAENDPFKTPGEQNAEQESEEEGQVTVQQMLDSSSNMDEDPDPTKRLDARERAAPEGTTNRQANMDAFGNNHSGLDATFEGAPLPDGAPQDYTVEPLAETPPLDTAPEVGALPPVVVPEPEAVSPPSAEPFEQNVPEPSLPTPSPDPVFTLPDLPGQDAPDLVAQALERPDLIDVNTDDPDVIDPPEEPQTEANAPIVTAGAAEGYEDNGIPIDISANINDTDGGTETLTIHVTGIPDGATLSAGTRNPDGSWSLSPADLTDLKVFPAPNSDEDFTLKFEVTSHDPNGSTATTVVSVPVTVDAVADMPTLSAGDVTGNEDGAIGLDIKSALTDTDGSETLTVTITGVPTGATLSAGHANPDGSWTLNAGDLKGLSITPPENFSGDINLTVTSTATENVNGSTELTLDNNVASTSTNITIHVDPVSDAGSVVVGAGQGYEDLGNGDIALDIKVTAGEADETAWVVISNVPGGVTFNHGTVQPDGSVKVSSGDLGDLKIVGLPANSDADLDLTVTPYSQDGAATPVAGPSQTLHVTIDAVADTPTLSAGNSTGNEDTAIGLDIKSALTDTDGSESLAITITGVPDGATLSAGTRNPDGSWTLSSDQLSGLTVTPPENFSGDIRLDITATSHEGATGSSELTLGNNTASTSTSITIHVDAVSDTPTLSVDNSQGYEDLGGGDIALKIDVTPGDSDETAWVVITGVPAGVTLNAGSIQPDGSIKVSSQDIGGLKIVGLPADSDADFNLTVTPYSQDGTAAPAAGEPQQIHVTVDAVADAPTIGVTGGSGTEDQPIDLNISNALSDTDGSETLGPVVVTGVPDGASLSAGTYNATDKTWTVAQSDLAGLKLTPPSDYNGTFDLKFTVTSTEGATGSNELTLDNNSASTSTSLTVKIMPDADGGSFTVHHGVNVNEDLGAASKGAGSAGTSGGYANVAGDEAASGAVDISMNVSADKANESAFVVVSNVPSGVTFNHAGTAWGGGIKFTAEEAADLKITGLPANSDADFTLKVDAYTQDTNSLGTDYNKFDSGTISVGVDAVADVPNLSTKNASVAEDPTSNNGRFEVSLGASVQDNSESLTVQISGVPEGFSVYNSNSGSGQWTLVDASTGTWERTVPAGSSNAAVGSVWFDPPANYNGKFQVSVHATATEAGGNDTDLSDNVASRDSTLTVTVTPRADTGALTLTHTAPELREDMGKASSGHGDANTTGGSADGIPDAGQAAVDFPIKVATGVPGEVPFVLISGVPAGVTLSPTGTLVTINGVTGYKFSADDAAHLQITGLPANSDADFTLTIRPGSVDAKDGMSNTGLGTAQSVTIKVDAVADVPTLVVKDVSTNEDSGAIDISGAIKANLTDKDGSESLSVDFSGVPSGYHVEIGGQTLTPNADGSYTLSQGQLASIAGGTKLTLVGDDSKVNWSGDFDISVKATSHEGVATEGHMSDNTATRSDSFTVHVDSVADAPTLTLPTQVTGDEDSKIHLDIGGMLTDKDGSESLTVDLGGLPVGSKVYYTVDGVEHEATGTVKGDKVYFDDVPFKSGHTDISVLPPTNSDADFTVDVTLTSTEQANSPLNNTGNDSASVHGTINVKVDAVADAPAFEIKGVSEHESKIDSDSGSVALNIEAKLTDADGSETITSIVIGRVPEGMQLSAGTLTGVEVIDGKVYTTWTMTPDEAKTVHLEGVATHFSSPHDGQIPLTVSAVTLESDNKDTATTTIDFVVDIKPSVDNFNASGSATGLEDSDIPLTINPGLVDKDGSEAIVGTVYLHGLPDGAVLKVNGEVVTANSDGWYAVPAEDIGHVTVKAPQDSNTDFNLDLKVTVGETNADGSVVPGETKTVTIPGGVHVDVIGVADTPTVTASDAAGNEGDAIQLDLSGKLGEVGDGADGSESIHYIIGGMPDLLEGDTSHDFLSLGDGAPAGAVLFNNGDGAPAGAVLFNNGDGTWTVSKEALPFVQYTTNSVADGTTETAHLTITPVVVENDANLGQGDASPGVLIGQPVPFDVVVTDGPDTGTGGPGGETPTDPIGFNLTDIKPGVEDHSTTASIGLTEGSVPNGAQVSVILTVPAGASVESVPGVSEVFYLGNNKFAVHLIDPANGTDAIIITPPDDFAGDLPIQVDTITTYADGHSSINHGDVAEVPFVPDADTPSVGGAGGTGTEDTKIHLDLSAGVNDSSESITAVYLSNLPEGSTVYVNGVAVAPGSDGKIAIDPADIGKVDLLPPDDFSGKLNVTLTAVSTDSVVAGGTLHTDTASNSTTISVTVKADADEPTLNAPTVINGSEDSGLAIGGALGIGGALNDTDGSEVLSYSIKVEASDWPEGAYFSAGHDGGLVVENGVTYHVWTMSPSDLGSAQLQFTGNYKGFNGDIPLQVTANSIEKSNGDAAHSPTETVVLHVEPVADAFSVVVKDAAGNIGETTVNEDSAASLTITPTIDGHQQYKTEGFSFDVTGVPAGAKVYYVDAAGVQHELSGTTAADGTLVFSGLKADQTNLQVLPPANSGDDFQVTVTTHATEANGSVADTVNHFDVHVNAVADAPTMSNSAVAGDEDSKITLDINADFADKDGSETQVLRITSIPDGSHIWVGGVEVAISGGSVTIPADQIDHIQFQAPENYNGQIKLGVEGIATEANGSTAHSSSTVTIDVASVNDDPTGADKTISMDEDGHRSFSASDFGFADVDTGDTLGGVRIDSLPANGQLVLDGHVVVAGTVVAAADIGKLVYTPGADEHGAGYASFGFSVQDNHGAFAATPNTISFDVAAVNDAPVVAAGAPGEGTVDGTTYHVPVAPAVSVSDIDSPYLTSASITIGNGFADGDKLEIGGYTIGDDGSIGDTGIKIVGGGFDDATHSLKLEGDASPDVYEDVLSSIQLTPAGAGNRAISFEVSDGELSGSATTNVAISSDVFGTDSGEGTTMAGGFFNALGGDDSVLGTTGNDIILGGEGHDLLMGNGGQDALNGGNGDDTLIGGTGNDHAVGGEGNDVFVFQQGGGNDTFDGGTGDNMLFLQDVGAPGDWTLMVDGQAVDMTGMDNMKFAEAVSGAVVFGDGSEMHFTDIQRIEWT